MKKSFAIIGCGHIANRHVEHINNHPLGQLIGVYDIDPIILKRFAEKQGVKAFLSEEELLSNDAVDVVNICTPNGNHADIAIS